MTDEIVKLTIVLIMVKLSEASVLERVNVSSYNMRLIRLNFSVNS